MRTDVTVAGVALQQGDRLEPSRALLDTHALETAELPITVCLWRTRRGDGGKAIDAVSHRCLLFSQRLHTSPASSLAIDSLHTLFLGPVLRFVSAALWRILLLNPWEFRGGVKAATSMGILRLKGDLDRWQTDPANNIPKERRVSNLTLNMMGSRMKCNLQERVLFACSDVAAII